MIKDRIMDMAQKAGLNAWDDDSKYEILKKASDMRFDANAQDLPVSERLKRTNDYLRLLGASDDQIQQVNAEYNQSGIIKTPRVEITDLGRASPNLNVLEDTLGSESRPKSFLGARSVDSGVIGTGEVLKKFGDYVDSNPIAKYALEGLDIVSGPTLYAVRNYTPVGDLMQQATGKVAGIFSEGFENVGRSQAEAGNGAIGGVAVLSVGASGFAGAYKGIRSALAEFHAAEAAAGSATRATHGIFVETGAGSTHYGPLDHLGRPTGVKASVTPDMIMTGTPAKSTINPPGWAGNGTKYNQARGHLLGNQLGGSGDIPENLITLQHIPVNTPEMRGFEAQVRAAVESGQVVQYSATPVYVGNNLVPRGVTLVGNGSNGFNLGVSVLNPIGR